MIRLSHVTKHYGGFRAVDDLNLTVDKGSLFGFIGPNGAGKTTTIRLLAGILVPDAGDIEICGIRMAENPEETKRVTGFIPDRPYLYEKLTGMEFLKFTADLYRLPPARFRQRAEKYIELFSLKDYLYDLIESYSHGMRQRLIMAAALVHDPEVIIVDEPMVGLDPSAIRIVKKMFTDLAAAGKTVFMSTHTLQIAQEICDTIAVIHKGKIAAQGSYDSLQRESGTTRADLEDIFLNLTGA
ncbi:MAG: ABC transporter ATP-binding protein [Desulfarculaceae bacterium]|nr:ABC transporter ATP-binding protein [Desulfarculaceae bacterium]